MEASSPMGCLATQVPLEAKPCKHLTTLLKTPQQEFL